MDSAELKETEVIMTFTLLNEEETEDASSDYQESKLMKSVLTSGWCSNKQIRSAIDVGYKLTMIAKKSDGREFANMTVGYEECVCSEQTGDMCVIKY